MAAAPTPPNRRSPRRRKLGYVLMAAGLLGGLGFWFWLVPFHHSSTPEFDPHRSPAGFWRDKQHMLRIGPWLHADGEVVAMFGDASWMRKIMRMLKNGEEVMSCVGGHKEAVLEYLANRTFPSGKDDGLDSWRQAWLDWWQENQNRSLEEWIQDGFKEQDFDISLPPSQEDWPKLLEILGAVAGPSPNEREKVEILYPHHLRYNAYRWLRDSGFEAMKYVLEQKPGALTGEQLGGLLEYDKFERNLFVPPPPGRLAFAPEWEWGGLLGFYPSNGYPLFLKPVPQAVFTGSCALLFLFGRWLVGSARRREAAALSCTVDATDGASPANPDAAHP